MSAATAFPTRRLEQIVSMGGFLTVEDVQRFTENPSTRHLNVLIRCHTDRLVVPMHRVEAVVEQHFEDLRDVSLTAAECARLREHG